MKTWKWLHQKAVPWILAVCVWTSCVPQAVFAEEATTRMQAAQYICEAADDYAEGLSEEALLSAVSIGPDGKGAALARVEGYALLSQAFGTLPEPVGNNALSGNFGYKIPTLPVRFEKYRADIENLAHAGLLTDDGPIDGPMGKEELERLVRRIFAYLGSNLKDDFYAATNKALLDGAALTPGNSTDGAAERAEQTTKEKLLLILDGLLTQDFEEGSQEQKLSDFYRMALDFDAQEADAKRVLQPYLKQIDEASSIAELLAAAVRIEKETGTANLLDFIVEEDQEDGNKNAVYFYGMNSYFDPEEFSSPVFKKSLAALVEAILTSMGEEDAKAQAAAFCRLAEENAERVETYYDVTKPSTAEELQALFPEADLFSYMKALGIPEISTLYIDNWDMAEWLGNKLRQEALADWKCYLKASLLLTNWDLLGTNARTAMDGFNRSYYGVQDGLSEKENALLICSAYMSDDLGQLYVAKYFPEEAKQDVEDMAEEFIKTYQDRLLALDWMSGKTKQEAVDKLSKMQVEIGYPDDWHSVWEHFEIASPKKGGSLIETVFMLQSAILEANIKSLSRAPGKGGWSMAVYEVNAYNDFSENKIVFPAGILQPPYYTYGDSWEANLGAAAGSIAHEISHAFDYEGAMFDGDGNFVDWWEAEDYQKFEEKCREVNAFYQGKEAAPGIAVDGKKTLSENIADLGGMACALEVLEKRAGTEEIDYDAFFRAYSLSWWQAGVRNYFSYAAQLDEHAASNLRVNEVLKNFPQFYETYEITEEDGMYLPPEERVGIW